MWAAMIHGPGDVRISEVPEPTAGAGDVLVEVHGVAPCGSDRHKYRRHKGKPRMWGHEVSGEIVSRGSSVPSSLRSGLHAVLLPVYGCMDCSHCESGRYVLCEKPRVISGGFAERISVPWQIVLPVPNEMPWEIATLLPDVVCVPAAALKRTYVAPNQKVLITGAGPIGLSAAMQAKLAGATVGIIDRLDERLAMSKRFVDLVAPSIDHPALARFEPDVVLECTGARCLLEAAVDLVAKDGWVCSVGGGSEPIAINPDGSLIQRMVKLTGTWCFHKMDFASHIRPVVEGELDLRPLISRTFVLEEVQDALTAWDEDPSVMKVILLS